MLLRIPRRREKNAISNHKTLIDPKTCTGCEVCLEKCQVQAITMNSEGLAKINYDRCIGCGLCASACPVEAISLVPKPAEQQDRPTASLHEQSVLLAKIRGFENVDRKHIVSYGYE
jgi:electron transport complex protein RnfB